VCDDVAVTLDAYQLRALFSHDGAFPDVDGAYVRFTQIPLRERKREGEWPPRQPDRVARPSAKPTLVPVTAARPASD
jgi:hypothetical protein